MSNVFDAIVKYIYPSFTGYKSSNTVSEQVRFITINNYPGTVNIISVSLSSYPFHQYAFLLSPLSGFSTDAESCCSTETSPPRHFQRGCSMRHCSRSRSRPRWYSRSRSVSEMMITLRGIVHRLYCRSADGEGGGRSLCSETRKIHSVNPNNRIARFSHPFIIFDVNTAYPL